MTGIIFEIFDGDFTWNNLFKKDRRVQEEGDGVETEQQLSQTDIARLFPQGFGKAMEKFAENANAIEGQFTLVDDPTLLTDNGEEQTS